MILAILGIMFTVIPNTRLTLLEFDHTIYFVETFYIGFSLLLSVLIIYLIPIIIPPKREFKPETLMFFCPNCGSKLIFSESMVKCSHCGYTLNDCDETISIPVVDFISILDLALNGCGNVCIYAQHIGECAIVRKYAEIFNAALPRDCPYRFIVKKK